MNATSQRALPLISLQRFFQQFLQQRGWHWLGQLLLASVLLSLLVFLAWPMCSILQKALQDTQGNWIGLANFSSTFSEARIWQACWNSIWLALTTAAIVLPTALGAAFALVRSRLVGRGYLRAGLLLPMLCPSLLPAISLVYLFGNQGLLKSWLGGASIYGPLGIILGEVFYTLPHAILILSTALSVADARLYEAAQSLGASRWRQFISITLPGIRYALYSVVLLVLTMVVTDFGVAKVIGGQTQVLALEAYKQVIGQQNFARGAVIGLVLLAPALFSFVLERQAAQRQDSVINARSQVLHIKPNRWRDGALAILSLALLSFVLALFVTGIAAAFIKLWPYQMSFSLAHFKFDEVDGGGWAAFANSLQLAFWTATFGTVLLLAATFLSIKLLPQHRFSRWIQQLAWWPMAIPGMVLGLAYIFCFNQPSHPLHSWYGSMALMVASTILHFFTTAYLTLATSLRKLDKEFEAANASMGRSWLTAFWRVSLPLCLPALLDVFRYFFVSAMTTVSAVIFLYKPETVLASVSVLNMDDAGDTAEAAAMASLIVLTSLLVNIVLHYLARFLQRRHAGWQSPT